MRKTLRILLIIWVIGCSSAVAQNFDACGYLQHGVEAGCVIFVSDQGGGYLVGDTGPFTIGDHVRIIGTVDPSCVTFCMQGACLHVDQISECVTDCCGLYSSGLTGNVNCDVSGKFNLADITRLIDRVYMSHQPLCCEANGNTDGDELGKLNLADITRLIDNIYGSNSQNAPCR